MQDRNTANAQYTLTSVQAINQWLGIVLSLIIFLLLVFERTQSKKGKEYSLSVYYGHYVFPLKNVKIGSISIMEKGWIPNFPKKKK